MKTIKSNNNNENPRYVIDINNDGRDDIIGFGKSGIEVAISNSNTQGVFYQQNLVFDDLTECKGWIDQETYPRYIGNINNDGFNDLVGFGFSQVHSFNGFNPATYTLSKELNTINQTIDDKIHKDSKLDYTNISIYTNPITGDFIFNSDITIQYIEVFNSFGQMIYKVKCNDNNGVINTSHLNYGVYIIKLMSNHGSISKKIVK